LHENNTMTSIKERFNKWKNTRKGWQKAGDILFWVFLILLIIPGPRKIISTTINRISLHLRNPSIEKMEKQQQLSEADYGWFVIDNDGKKISLSNFRDEVVFLNFWATWCPPCIAELPEIEKLYNKFDDRVNFLLVTNEDPVKVNNFLESRGYNLPVYYSAVAPPEVFSGRALPTTYIISAEGRIVVRKTGAANWDSRATTKIFRELMP